ncbi:hypothetical protein [Clavibacter lycopersici]|nr:hypothetical protein [Clavibacter lycopersici]
MFRWRRGKSVPTEAAPAAPDARSTTRTAERDPAAGPPAPPAPAVSTATGELAAIAARLHGGPVRPTHVPAHKAVPGEPPTRTATADDDVRTAPDADPQPDMRPLALIVQAALAHHFGPDGAWALVRRTPDTTAGFFDELMTAHIARDVALALGASPATAALPLEDARAAGSVARDDAVRQDAVVRELAVFDEDPLDDVIAELVGAPRRVPAALRAVRSA